MGYGDIDLSTRLVYLTHKSPNINNALDRTDTPPNTPPTVDTCCVDIVSSLKNKLM